MFLSILAFICSIEREVTLEEEFRTIDAKNNTDEIEEPIENTGKMDNNFIVKGYQRLREDVCVIFAGEIWLQNLRLRAVGS